MAHERPRIILPTLIKRLKLWPVLGIVGVRQSGKSVLLRDLLLPKIHGKYRTLDSITERARAESSPESFTEPDDGGSSKKGRIQIIDEVQKVPDLFDSLKLHVDQNRRPGMYIVSGSTEFSKLTGIRESLTGRIGILRLYPLCLNELYENAAFGSYWIQALTPTREIRASLSLEGFDRKLERGGMPGLCFIRNPQEFSASSDMWLETTCYRDLQQVRVGKFDGSLGQAILGQVARLAEPTAAVIARAVKRDARVVTRYLNAFEAILVLHRIDPYPSGVGKSLYSLCDVGLASHLGASRESLFRTHLLYEALATFEASGLVRPQVYYYRNEKTSRVPLIFDWQGRKGAPRSIALQYHDSESLHARDLSSLLAFADRSDWSGRLLMLTQTKTSYIEGKVEILPLRG